MPNLFAMSFEGELAPSFDLRCLREGALPDGWGIGFYPGGEPSASVLKEPAPPRGSIRSEIVKTWEHVASSVFVLHIRSARWGQNSDANTQPFLRSHSGRDFLAAHSGSLKRRFALSTSGLEYAPSPRYEPVGSTDTELIFCELLNRCAEQGKRSLSEVAPLVLQGWLDELNDHGTLSLVLTDGRDLVVYADRRGETRLHLWQLFPPYERVVFGDSELTVDLTRRGPKSRKGVLVASEPLANMGGVEPSWQVVAPGELVILRQGAVIERVPPRIGQTGNADLRTSVPRLVVSRPKATEAKTFRIVHATTYRYANAVQRSQHIIRLAPFHDRLQEVRHHDLEVSVEGQMVDYDDVFGNRVRRVNLESPWSELRLVARSQVRVYDVDPLGTSVYRRSAIPLVWMPWQRQVLQPFLLPPELPDSQLAELSEYAMSFVERNDYDLLDTLLDLNHAIHKEYRYEPGSSTLATTPFETYQARRGVCQDFANLFICLSRLLSVPARYVCGYIYTGNNPNQAQGDASHAWVQVYLPTTGWKGFDPTNGILTQTDHVRVAVGRNYVDATPTSGTIYLGGGAETLSVDVRVECDS